MIEHAVVERCRARVRDGQRTWLEDAREYLELTEQAASVPEGLDFVPESVLRERTAALNHTLLDLCTALQARNRSFLAVSVAGLAREALALAVAAGVDPVPSWEDLRDEVLETADDGGPA